MSPDIGSAFATGLAIGLTAWAGSSLSRIAVALERLVRTDSKVSPDSAKEAEQGNSKV